MAAAGTAAARRPRPAPAPATSGRPPVRLFEPAPRRSRRRSRHSTVVAAALIVGSLLAVVVGDDLVAQDQIAIATVGQQTAAAAARQQQLRISVAELSAPQVIVSEADRQGLAPATKVVDLPPVPLDVPLAVPNTGRPVTAAPTAAGAGNSPAAHPPVAAP